MPPSESDPRETSVLLTSKVVAGEHDFSEAVGQAAVDELAARGVELPAGWSIGQVAAISADGTTIIGTGINAGGVQEPWRIRLD